MKLLSKKKKGQILDHPSRELEAAAGASRLPGTAGESEGERRRDGAGSLPDLGYPVTPMLAHMLARVVDGTDFRASRSGGGSEPAAGRHSRQECGRAMARPRFRRTRDVCMQECMNAMFISPPL
jgi:hypothetical protein